MYKECPVCHWHGRIPLNQSEFQDAIEWIDGMNYCAVDSDGRVSQYIEQPRFTGTFWVGYVFENTNHFERITDPKNWLFKRDGEL